MNVKELFAKIGEGNFPLTAFRGEDCIGVAFNDMDSVFDITLVPVRDEDMKPGDIRLDDHNQDTINLIIHCVNNFMPLLEALEEMLEGVELCTPDAPDPLPHSIIGRARAVIAAAKEVK
jgi:hypothetical protein